MRRLALRLLDRGCGDEGEVGVEVVYDVAPATVGAGAPKLKTVIALSLFAGWLIGESQPASKVRTVATSKLEIKSLIIGPRYRDISFLMVIQRN